MNMPAVQAHPVLIFFAFKILIVLQHAGQFAKPLCMRLLYPRDLVERGCHFYEAFFFGYISEVLVHILILFHLVMLCGFQQFAHAVKMVYRVASVNMDGCSRKVLKQIIEALCMSALLIRSKEKYLVDGK